MLLLSKQVCRGIIAAALCFACLSTPAGAQAAAKPVPADEPTTVSVPQHPPTDREMRDAQIAADTEKLYQLARELKVELDKSTKDTLSLTVIKKAAEIERLAHSLGERMKTR